jgi:8-oxo-dGTP diphosphatase
MVSINFYDSNYIPDGEVTYSVIVSRYMGKWIFVRHHQRCTFEIPGGHIEKNETPYDAAGRELIEETGAISFTLESICTYSVQKGKRKDYGKLFFAEISEIGQVKDISEIGEVMLQENLPENLTYPDIQPYLFKKAISYIQR